MYSTIEQSLPETYLQYGNGWRDDQPMRPMHILHVTSEMGCGGAQRIIVGLAEEAVLRGHKVSILMMRSRNDFVDRLQSANISTHSLAYNGRYTPAYFPHLAGLRRQLVRAVARINPTIIHSHLFLPKLIMFGMSTLAGKPVLLTEHGTNPWWGKYSPYSLLQTYTDYLFAHRTAREIVAVSESVREHVIRELRLRPERCLSIPNFIDLPPDGLVRKSRTPGSFTLLVVARLQAELKGLYTALDILRLVRHDFPTSRLVMVGDGPDRSALEQRARTLGLQDVVEFKGYQEDVLPFYQQADVVLVPSRFEGFGLSAAEAAAMGLPVVASNVGGIPEVVAHGTTGFVCNRDDPAAFACAIKKLFTDVALYETLSKNAVIRSNALVGRSGAFEAYERLYYRILQQAQPGVIDA